MKKITFLNYGILTIFLFVFNIKVAQSGKNKKEITADQILYSLKVSQPEKTVNLFGTMRKSISYFEQVKYNITLRITGKQVLFFISKDKKLLEVIRIVKYLDKIEISNFTTFGLYENVIKNINKIFNKGKLSYWDNYKNFELVESKDFHKNIVGADITYYDLSMGFIFWKESKILSKKAVLNRRLMYKIEVLNTNKEVLEDKEIKAYDKVHMWVDKKYFSPMKVEAFDKKGNIFKRVIITAIQKENKMWVPKQMRYETFKINKNGKNKLEGRSYLDFK